MRAAVRPSKDPAIFTFRQALAGKSFSPLIRLNISTKTLLTLITLLLVACGGDVPEPAPTPDMTGSWSGTYVSADASFSFDLNITSQQQQSFSGIWKWSASASWPADSQARGYTHPSNDYRSLVDLSLTRGGTIECCMPLLGCSVIPLESLEMYGYLDNNRVTDQTASYHYGCYASARGEMIIKR